MSLWNQLTTIISEVENRIDAVLDNHQHQQHQDNDNKSHVESSSSPIRPVSSQPHSNPSSHETQQDPNLKQQHDASQIHPQPPANLNSSSNTLGVFSPFTSKCIFVVVFSLFLHLLVGSY